MAKKTTGKGFGKQPPPSPSPPPPSTTTPPKTEPTKATLPSLQTPSPTSPSSPLSGGQDALQRLRRVEAEKRDEELRAIRDLQTVDRDVSSLEQSAVIPEPVAMRMGMRMLPFVGVPLFGGMGVFVAFWYFATYKGLEFQPSLVAYSTIAVLAVGLLGITYSVISASWDPEIEGSALGITEFQTNIGNIQSGLRRSRENLLLREKMNKIPQDEMDSSLSKLEKAEEKAERKRLDGLGLKEKLEKELE